MNTEWTPIEKLDRTQMQFLLVYEDGAMRMRLWSPGGFWELSDVFGQRVTDLDQCSSPTHFMVLPKPPRL